jgi:nicotinamide N-methyltransferase
MAVASIPLSDTESTLSAPILPSFGNSNSRILYRPPLFASHSTPPTDIRSEERTLPVQICVTVPPATITPLFAHRQWRAGILLANALAQGHINVHGKRVIELGAGTGLPGIVAALSNTQRTVITDYDAPHIVTRLRENVWANLPPHMKENRSVGVHGFSWGTDPEDVLYDPSTRSNARFDAVLCADVMWDAFSHDSLMRSIKAVLAPGGTVYVVAGLHTGREVLAKFWRLARITGFRVQGADMGWQNAEDMWEWKIQTDEGEEEETEDGLLVRSSLSGEKRLFDEARVEDVAIRNGWITLSKLVWLQ